MAHWLNQINRRIDHNRALQFFNISRFSANFLSGWLLVKSGLPIEEVAAYETLVFLGALFTFFWHAGGQNALLSYFPQLSGSARERLPFNVFVSFCLLSAISAGALWMSAGFIGRQFQLQAGLPYLPWLCLYIAFNIPAFLTHLFFLLADKAPKIVAYAAWSFSAQVLVVGAPVFLGAGLRYVFMGLALLALVRFGFALTVLGRRGAFSLDFRLIKNWSLISLPLSLHILVGNGMEYIDGWIVSHFFTGEGAFAVFRFGARELPLVSLIVGALITSSIPIATANLAQGAALLKKETLKLARWMYPLSIALFFLSPLLYPWVYDKPFIESAWIFNIYLLILAFRLLLPQVLLIGAGERYFLVFGALLETGLNIALSLWWLGPFGLRGVALATVAANAFSKGLLIWYGWFKLGIRPSAYTPWKPLLAYNAALGAGFFFSYWLFHP